MYLWFYVHFFIFSNNSNNNKYIVTVHYIDTVCLVARKYPVCKNHPLGFSRETVGQNQA